MPDLMLLRHAKSDWTARYGADQNRPLNKRGVRSARAVGEFVARYRLTPELVPSAGNNIFVFALPD